MGSSYTRCISFPTLLVFSLTLLTVYTVVVLVIDPLLGIESAHGLFHTLLFFLEFLVIHTSYFLSIFRDPGSIPPHYSPEGEEEGFMGLTEVKRKGGQARYCQKCFVFKPARAHHCRICKRCVLRMDHHCIWINNCVGHRNYKPFLLFVFFTEFALLHGLGLMLNQFVIEWSERGNRSWGGRETKSSSEANLHLPHRSSPFLSSWGLSETSSFYLRVVCLLFMVPLAISLLVLLLWNIYLLSKNKTTIEHYEGVRAKWLATKSGEKDHYHHPYDLGVVDNLHVILGPQVMFWFCPVVNQYVGDGLTFKTSVDVRQFTYETHESCCRSHK